jgi:hypothetical protein
MNTHADLKYNRQNLFLDSFPRASNCSGVACPMDGSSSILPIIDNTSVASADVPLCRILTVNEKEKVYYDVWLKLQI